MATAADLLESAEYFRQAELDVRLRVQVAALVIEEQQLRRDAKAFEKRAQEERLPALIDECEHYAACSVQIADRLKARIDALRETDATTKVGQSSIEIEHAKNAIWALELAAANAAVGA
jgi:hypothetical protein